MKAWSQIAVVGAGAVGCYFGAMLACAGNKVTLIGRQNHVDAINRDGLLFRSRGAEERVRIAATTDIAGVGGASLVLFCVKSLDTEDAAREMAPHLAPDAVILSLQNGVDNVERIGLHFKNKAMPALVYTAVQMLAPGTVEHTGGGNLVVGQAAQEIAALFTTAGVPVKVSENIDIELWTKLVMNCAYNAICALSGAPYGQMVAMPEVAGVMRDIVSEVAAVAKGKGVHLPLDIADAAIRLADVMPRTMSSTAQDIAKGKRTETEHLNGTVVRQGEALGIPTPVNRTLNALMKLLEQTKSGSPV
jgi:2-dehydropantoate 2-reductase